MKRLISGVKMPMGQVITLTFFCTVMTLSAIASPVKEHMVEVKCLDPGDLPKERQSVGIYEYVSLTLTGVDKADYKKVTWAFTGDRHEASLDGAATSRGITVSYQAAAIKCDNTIVATYEGNPYPVVFKVVAPEGQLFIKTSNSHKKDSLSAGFSANVYMAPKEVSFLALEEKEYGVDAVADGCLEYLNGLKHMEGKVWIACEKGNVKNGSACGADAVLSSADPAAKAADYAFPDRKPTKGDSNFLWKIPVKYKKRGAGEKDAVEFCKVKHTSHINSDQWTMKTDKENETSGAINAKSDTINFPPK